MEQKDQRPAPDIGKVAMGRIALPVRRLQLYKRIDAGRALEEMGYKVAGKTTETFDAAPRATRPVVA